MKKRTVLVVGIIAMVASSMTIVADSIAKKSTATSDYLMELTSSLKNKKAEKPVEPEITVCITE